MFAWWPHRLESLLFLGRQPLVLLRRGYLAFEKLLELLPSSRWILPRSREFLESLGVCVEVCTPLPEPGAEPGAIHRQLAASLRHLSICRALPHMCHARR